jgi:hypothetical protein
MDSNLGGTTGSQSTSQPSNNPGFSASPTGQGQNQGQTQSQGIKTQVTNQARNLVDKAGSQARERIDTGKREAAMTLSSVANTLHQSGAQLRDEQQNMASEYVQRAADQIERVANYVQNTELTEIVDNVENFARRRPAVFLGAAFALGIIGARFIKSSQNEMALARRSGYDGFDDREVPTSISNESTGSMGSPTPSQWMGGDGGQL